jgi:hypothetical protein
MSQAKGWVVAAWTGGDALGLQRFAVSEVKRILSLSTQDRDKVEASFVSLSLSLSLSLFLSSFLSSSSLAHSPTPLRYTSSER